MSRNAPLLHSAHRLLIPVSTLLALSLAPLHAQTTFTVNATGDGADANTGDGVCDDGAGSCALRAALEQANAAVGLDTIHFNIPGTGLHTITPATSLPIITDPVVIDGSTEPGASRSVRAMAASAWAPRPSPSHARRLSNFASCDHAAA